VRVREEGCQRAHGDDGALAHGCAAGAAAAGREGRRAR